MKLNTEALGPDRCSLDGHLFQELANELCCIRCGELAREIKYDL